MGVSADEETIVDIDVNIDDDVCCNGIRWVLEPDDVCDNPAKWRRLRHCEGPTRLYCVECKEFLDESARKGDLQCAGCQKALPYDPKRWTRI